MLCETFYQRESLSAVHFKKFQIDWTVLIFQWLTPVRTLPVFKNKNNWAEAGSRPDSVACQSQTFPVFSVLPASDETYNVNVLAFSLFLMDVVQF